MLWSPLFKLKGCAMGRPYPFLQKETDLKKQHSLSRDQTWLLTYLPACLPTFLLIYQSAYLLITNPHTYPSHLQLQTGSNHSRCRVHMFLKAGKRLCSVKTSSCQEALSEKKTHRKTLRSNPVFAGVNLMLVSGMVCIQIIPDPPFWKHQQYGLGWFFPYWPVAPKFSRYIKKNIPTLHINTELYIYIYFTSFNGIFQSSLQHNAPSEVPAPICQLQDCNWM